MILPRPNLPNDAQPWGRAITDSTQNNSDRLDRLESARTSENRAMAGQMGAVGRQITELGSRDTRTINGASLTVTSTSSTSFSSGTRNISIPGTGSQPRYALLIVSAPVQRSGSLSGPFVTVSFDGVVYYRDTVGQSTGGVVPSDWGNSLNAPFSVRIPPSGGTLSIKMELSIFAGSSGSATITNPEVSVYFTDATIM